MNGVDSWLDIARVGVAILSLWCCYMLISGLRNYGDEWSVKTKDLWYAVFAWAAVGVVQPIQGILLDRPLTPAFVLVTAAVLVTGKGLAKRGPWGDPVDRHP